MELNFKKAAIYKIKVLGLIEDSSSDRYRGMQLTVERTKGNKIFSMLVGEIRDQSALSGILKDLYESHLTVISIDMLTEFNTD